MKKSIALLLTLALVFALAACSPSTPAPAEPAPAEPAPEQPAEPEAPAPEVEEGVTKDNIKIGVVHILDPSDMGYTYNHDLGAKGMIENLGLREDQYIPKYNIPDDTDACVAAMNELIESGCQIIFTTSFGYGNYTKEMAAAYPEIEFCHATGADALTANLPNFHNYFAKIHQARYLAGIAAGLKTENNHLGYVAAFPFAEVISGYTAFYLGAKSVNPDVTMSVMYANTWGDPNIEGRVAQSLIDLGCDVLGQHSDSTTPATTAEANGVWQVGYNNDMIPAAPKASLISARIDWSKYMTYAVQCVLDGQAIAVDWGEGYAEEAVYLSPLNEDIAAPGTKEAIEEAAAKIISGELKVFTGPLLGADGQPVTITTYGGDPIMTLSEGAVFLESDNPSAPSFNCIIAGITEVE